LAGITGSKYSSIQLPDADFAACNKNTVPYALNNHEINIVLQKDNNIYLFTIKGEGYGHEMDKTWDQILSTFKFLDTSGTKIYKEKEFSFSYPSNRTPEVKMRPDGSGFVYFNRNDVLRHSILSLQIQLNTQSTLEETVDENDKKEYMWKPLFIGKTRILQSPEMFRKTVASYEEY